MRIKLKFLFLLPLLLTTTGCNPNNKITFQEESNTLETYYDDSYFDGDNAEVSSEIALASHAMALATFNGYEDYSQRSYYLRDLWKKEGFEKISMNHSFYERPETDSIGFGIASKKIQLLGGYYYLIAIAVRGGDYEGEWVSNLTVGTEGDSQGFSEASAQVIEGLSEYLHKNKIEGHIKIWISGFSRAAITSNITAGNILNNMDNKEYLSNKVHYTERDIYAYCFEPPLGVATTLDNARSPLYQGIHNFLNFNDLVPHVAPKEWGFVRYGTDHYYPDRLTDIYFDETEREKLISYYHFMRGAENFPKYTVDEWKFFNVGGQKAIDNNLPVDSVNPSLGRFCYALIDLIATNPMFTSELTNRELYAMLFQRGIRDLMSAVLGYNEDINGINMKNLVNVIFEYTFVQSLINELLDGRAGDFVPDVFPLLLQVFGADESNIEQIKELYNNVYWFLIYFATSFISRQDIVSQLVYRDNAMGLIIGHIPELSYAFLSCTDKRIMGDDACEFNDGSYEILHIENPVSFSLVETNINKQVFEYKDGVMSSKHLSAEKFADGRIDIYLPKNGHYEYVCEANSVSLSNFDPMLGESVLNDSLSKSSGTIN